MVASICPPAMLHSKQSKEPLIQPKQKHTLAFKFAGVFSLNSLKAEIGVRPMSYQRTS